MCFHHYFPKRQRLKLGCHFDIALLLDSVSLTLSNSSFLPHHLLSILVIFYNQFFCHKFHCLECMITSNAMITSWQIDGDTRETVINFIFLGSKITADSDCSHEIQRGLLLERKDMTKLDSVFKSKDITLPTNIHKGKAMVFPVVMYGFKSWTIRKAECQ